MNRIMEILKKSAIAGNSYITENELLSRCRIEDREAVKEELANGVEAGTFVRVQDRIYLPENHNYETLCAMIMSARLDTGFYVNEYKAESVISHVETEMGLLLDPDQKKAVRLALTQSTTLIMGGAGSGKTTLIRALCEANRTTRGGLTLVCAPTGRACKRIKELTGVRAKTIHQALKIRDNKGFLDYTVKQRKQWQQYTMVIVDEASMMSTKMLAGILTHIHAECALVLIGDLNQLPAVGAGCVLKDHYELGIPLVRLNRNYRQQEHNCALATNLRALEEHTFALPVYDKTFRFCEAETADDAQDSVIALKAAMDSQGMEVQVITPIRNVSVVGAACLNFAMQEILNPSEGDCAEFGMSPTVFRNGDPVALKRNDGILCNGDIGLLHISNGKGAELSIEVDFTETSTRWAEHDIFDKFELAYATTVHKAQGNEYDHVILVIPTGFDYMITRNLLYTAISRARKSITVVGNRKTFEKAFCSPACERNSGLVEKTNEFENMLPYYCRATVSY